MAEVGEQLGLARSGLGDGDRHRVEPAREVADLGRTLEGEGIDRRRGDVRGRGREAAQRRSDRTGDEPGERAADEERDEDDRGQGGDEIGQRIAGGPVLRGDDEGAHPAGGVRAEDDRPVGDQPPIGQRRDPVVGRGAPARIDHERAGGHGRRGVEADDAAVDRDDIGAQVRVGERRSDRRKDRGGVAGVDGLAGLDGERGRLILEPAAGGRASSVGLAVYLILSNDGNLLQILHIA